MQKKPDHDLIFPHPGLALSAPRPVAAEASAAPSGYAEKRAAFQHVVERARWDNTFRPRPALAPEPAPKPAPRRATIDIQFKPRGR